MAPVKVETEAELGNIVADGIVNQTPVVWVGGKHGRQTEQKAVADEMTCDAHA
jgi:hypothetical protein